MPKPYPEEFRDDVVRVARSCRPAVIIEQLARDFGVRPMTVTKWIRNAEIDEGATRGLPRAEDADLREARKRIRLLELRGSSRTP